MINDLLKLSVEVLNMLTQQKITLERSDFIRKRLVVTVRKTTFIRFHSCPAGTREGMRNNKSIQLRTFPEPVGFVTWEGVDEGGAWSGRGEESD